MSRELTPRPLRTPPRVRGHLRRRRARRAQLDRSLPPAVEHAGPDGARYELRDGTLRLRIDADQPPWCPELDGDLRVSSIQTATFSGPLGSTVGTHPFHPAARVRTPQPERRLYTPEGGLIEVRMRALDDPRVMVALWMIGIGDAPERSGEICVAEIFGRNVGPDRARVGMGIHPFEDPALTDDFEEVELAARRPRLAHVLGRLAGRARRLVRRRPSRPDGRAVAALPAAADARHLRVPRRRPGRTTGIGLPEGLRGRLRPGIMSTNPHCKACPAGVGCAPIGPLRVRRGPEGWRAGMQ